MSIPLPQADQYACRNESLEIYASDRRGEVTYQFNNLGYRNTVDYSVDNTNTGTYLGSSATSAIGIPWEQSFASISSSKLGVSCYHYSQGCTKLDNQEILKILTQLKRNNIPTQYYVVQFIDLDRRYDATTGECDTVTDSADNIELFERTFGMVNAMLKDSRWCFFGLDANGHDIPDYIRNHANCLGWNIPFVDQAGVGVHPGAKWHNMVALGIAKKLS